MWQLAVCDNYIGIDPNRMQNSPQITYLERLTGPDRLYIEYTIDTNPANADYPIKVEFYKSIVSSRDGAHKLRTADFNAAPGTTQNVTLNFLALPYDPVPRKTWGLQ